MSDARHLHRQQISLSDQGVQFGCRGRHVATTNLPRFRRGTSHSSTDIAVCRDELRLQRNWNDHRRNEVENRSYFTNGKISLKTSLYMEKKRECLHQFSKLSPPSSQWPKKIHDNSFCLMTWKHHTRGHRIFRLLKTILEDDFGTKSNGIGMSNNSSNMIKW